MTYPKNPKPERFATLGEYLTEIEELKPGERVILRCESTQATTRVRSLLYEWLNSVNLKGAFSLKRLSEKEILVKRKESSVQLIIQGEKIDKEIGILIEQLIEVWETPQAKKLITTWKTNGTLTEEEGTALWNKVARIMC